MKLTKKLLSMLLVLCMVLSMLPAVALFASAAATWDLVDISAISSTDVVVIAYKNSSGDYYAMGNDKGTGAAPTATKITVSNNQITSTVADTMKWNISNSGGDLTIYPNGSTSTWLYCTATNNGTRVGTNTNKTFTLGVDSGSTYLYLMHTYTSRYIGVYNNQDFRCYTTAANHTNIKQQTVCFFKYTAGASYTVTPAANNSSYGTVSLSGSTITATPQTGYYVTGSYTVSPTGAVSVTYNNNNTFTVGTPTADCTVTINFAASPTYTLTLSENGSTSTSSKYAGVSVTLPSGKDVGNYTFLGWTASATVSGEPADLMTAGSSYTMPAVNTTLYAVYAKASGSGGTGTAGTYELVTSAPSDWAGDYVIANTTSADYVLIADGSVTGTTYATAASVKTLSAAGITLSGTTLTNVSDAYVFTISETASGSGYYYIKMKGASSDLYLIANSTTSSSSLSTATSTGTTARWTIGGLGSGGNAYLIGNIGRYLGWNSSYSYFRAYAATNKDSYKAYLFKSTGSGASYSDWTTAPSGTATPTYTLTYNANTSDTVTGMPGAVADIPEGTVYTLSQEIPVRVGYTFMGWNTSASASTAMSTVTVKSDTTVYAIWQAKAQYTVSFYTKDGTDPVKVKYYHGDIIAADDAPPALEVEGFTFVGWYGATYSDSTAPTYANFAGTEVKSDLEFHAVYAKHGEGGSGSSITSLATGDYYMIDSIGGSYYAMSGTGTTVTAVDVTAYVTLNADGTLSVTDASGFTEAMAYTVTVTGSTATVQNVNNGSYVGPSTSTSFSISSGSWNVAASGNGFTFTSGSRGILYQSSSDVFKNYDTSNAGKSGYGSGALYLIPASGGSVEGYTTNPVVANSYTITWLSEGTVFATTTVKEGNTITAPATNPTKADIRDKYYTFAGWAATENGTVITDFGTASGNATYYAVFTEGTYATVNWIIDGVSETEYYKDGEVPAHATPSKPSDGTYSYIFSGWDPTPAAVTAGQTYTYTALFTQTEVRYTATLSLSKTTVRVGRSVTATSSFLADGTALTDYTPVYSTDDSTVATIDKSGNITTLAEGTVTITVTYTKDGKEYIASAELTVSNGFTGGYTLMTPNDVADGHDWSGDYVFAARYSGASGDLNNLWFLAAQADGSISTGTNTASQVQLTIDGKDATGTVTNGFTSEVVNVTMSSTDDRNATIDGKEYMVLDRIEEIGDSYVFTIELVDDVNQYYTIRLKDTSNYLTSVTNNAPAGSNEMNFDPSNVSESSLWTIRFATVSGDGLDEEGGYTPPVILIENVAAKNNGYSRAILANSSGTVRYAVYGSGAYNGGGALAKNSSNQSYSLYLYGNPNPFYAQIQYNGDVKTIVNPVEVPAGRTADVDLEGLLLPDVDTVVGYEQVGSPAWTISGNSSTNNGSDIQLTDATAGIFNIGSATSGAYATVTVTYQVKNLQTNQIVNVSTDAMIRVIDAAQAFDGVIYTGDSTAPVLTSTTVASGTNVGLNYYVVDDITGATSLESAPGFSVDTSRDPKLLWSAYSNMADDTTPNGVKSYFVAYDPAMNTWSLDTTGAVDGEIITVTMTGAGAKLDANSAYSDIANTPSFKIYITVSMQLVADTATLTSYDPIEIGVLDNDLNLPGDFVFYGLGETVDDIAKKPDTTDVDIGHYGSVTFLDGKVIYTPSTFVADGDEVVFYYAIQDNEGTVSYAKVTVTASGLVTESPDVKPGDVTYTLVTQKTVPTPDDYNFTGDYVIMGRLDADLIYLNKYQVMTPRWNEDGSVSIEAKGTAAGNNASLVNLGGIADGVATGNILSSYTSGDLIRMESTGKENIADDKGNIHTVLDQITYINQGYVFTFELVDDVNLYYTIRVKGTNYYLANSNTDLAGGNTMEYTNSADLNDTTMLWTIRWATTDDGLSATDGYTPDVLLIENVYSMQQANVSRAILYNNAGGNDVTANVDSGRFLVYGQNAYHNTNYTLAGASGGASYSIYLFGAPVPFTAQIQQDGEVKTFADPVTVSAGRTADVDLESLLLPDIDTEPNYELISEPVWTISGNSTTANGTDIRLTDDKEGTFNIGNATEGAYAIVTVTYTVLDKITGSIHDVSTDARIVITAEEQSFNGVIYTGEDSDPKTVSTNIVTGTAVELDYYVVDNMTSLTSLDADCGFTVYNEEGFQPAWMAVDTQGNSYNVSYDSATGKWIVDTTGVAAGEIITVTMSGAMAKLDGNLDYSKIANDPSFKIYVVDTLQLVADEATLSELNAIIIDVLANDLNLYTGAQICGLGMTAADIAANYQTANVAIGTYGTVSVTSDNMVIFTPNASIQENDIITFYYSVQGEDGSYYYAKVTITVDGLSAEGVLTTDTLVVDFGIPVTFAPTANDTGDFTNAKVTGITDSAGGTAMVSLELAEGTAALNAEGTVTFTPTRIMTAPAVFYYTVEYKKEVFTGTIQIIPATNVYYEDSMDGVFRFTPPEVWSTIGSTVEGAEQRADFVGDISSNVYGYDEAYTNFATYSMGSAHVAAVNEKYNLARVDFDFYGTGFDVISLTGGNSGYIMVAVCEYGTTNRVAGYVVDTYYGFTYDEEGQQVYTEEGELVYVYEDVGEGNGSYVLASGYQVPDGATVLESLDGKVYYYEYVGDGEGNYERVPLTQNWIPNPDASQDFYQVPVMKVSDLPANMYTVSIAAYYSNFYDHAGDGSYEFVFDAVRVYDPCGKNETATNAYQQDGENEPHYLNLRDELVNNAPSESVKPTEPSTEPGTDPDTKDYSGRYYIAAIRSKGNYWYMTNDLGKATTERYTAEDTTLTALPSEITSPESDKVFVLEQNKDGTYRIYSEGITGDAKYLGWSSGNSGTFVDSDNALSLNVTALDSGLFNISFVDSANEIRYLSLNGTAGNDYFAWYTGTQRHDLSLIPVTGESTDPKPTDPEPTDPTEPEETDYSGRYYIAGKRGGEINYKYIMGVKDGSRYDIEDSGLSTLPASITAPESNKVFVIEKNADGTYRIYAEGISDADKYLGWVSGNTGQFYPAEVALNLSIDALDSGLYNIYFYSSTDRQNRYLSLNSVASNTYAAWYLSGQIKDLALIPVTDGGTDPGPGTEDDTNRYYIAATRTSGNYWYMTNDLGTATVEQYTAEDSGLTVLPSEITAPESDKVFVLEQNVDGTYRIYSEGITGDAKYLGWSFGDSGAFVDSDNALNLNVTVLASGLFNISFVDSANEIRYLSLNGITGNDYFAWHTGAQVQDLALIPVTGESTDPKPEDTYTATFTSPDSDNAPKALTGGEIILPDMYSATCTFNDVPYTFLGWVEETVDNVTEPQKFLPAGTSVTLTKDVTYKALYTYDKTTESGGSSGTTEAFSIGKSGRYVIAANVGGTYYAMSNKFESKKISGTVITVTNGAVSEADASSYKVTLTNVSGNTYTIASGSSYLKYDSSTDLGSSTAAYNWTIATGKNGSWRIASATTTTRGLVFRASTYNQFGGYAISNISTGGKEYYDVEILPVASSGGSGSTTTAYYTTEIGTAATDSGYEVILTADPSNLLVDGTTTITATLMLDGKEIEDYSGVTWASNQSSVVSVETTAGNICYVKAVAPGKAQISATFTVGTETVTNYKEITVTAQTDATQPSSYSKTSNSGTRGVVCTSLSGTYADSYYTGSYAYENLSAQTGSTLLSTLRTMMSDSHSYTTSYDNCRDYAYKTDCQNEDGSVTLLYTGYQAAQSDFSGSTPGWNREHVWPKSLGGFETSGPGADLHHIRPDDVDTNGDRGNLKYGNVDESSATASTATITGANNALGGYYAGGYFEPLDEVKGDVARICMYVYVRYGGDTSYSGCANITNVFESIDTLLAWHELDPVDTWEMGRNVVVEELQGNRNVFIDYPELAWNLFNKTAPSGYTTPSTGSATTASVTADYVPYDLGNTTPLQTKNTGVPATKNTTTEEGTAAGLVFIDGNEAASLEEYEAHGPNNEIYLASSQAVAFNLKFNTLPKTIQIGLKSLEGTGTQSWFVVSCGRQNRTFKVTTATEMYYDITDIVSLGTTEDGQYASAYPIIITKTNGDLGSLTYLKWTSVASNTSTKASAATFLNESDIEDILDQVDEIVGNTEPAPSEEEPAPSEEEPAPSEEEPAPSEEEPAPSEEEPAPSEEEPAPSEEEPAPSEEEDDPVETPDVERFEDLDADAWYYEGVVYAVENGLMNGMGETEFAPDDTLTRAMLVTILYRQAGSPAVEEDTSFTDVTADAWYADAVAWAKAEGIAQGISATEFGPEQPVTREQMVTFLWRYAEEPEAMLGYGENPPADVDEVAAYAQTAMVWAYENEIIRGENGLLNPENNATRAQIANIFMRFEKMLALID